ncbi:hypothetical protein KBTX_00720 [wastewater metagenome]|uniref:Adenylyl-sulfate kinase n=2 Tax=unclassified sequences TaxID=12908 RepID=A0A5B8RAI6_9ZZZZ|nr:AAA family ATPase [Arhodomonas aquaeolei]QEA04412.1 hypothetical protein KBTEX_00720 [uncultured organism]
MRPATLFILSGLPGTGKTTLARRLASHRRAVHLRIDTIEQALREVCGCEVTSEGYALAQRIAADNLRAGLDVIADCVNPWPLTRRDWGSVATGAGVCHVNIEIRCSDPGEHRRRVERRHADAGSLPAPGWDDVCRRDYHPWQEPPLRLDTAGRTVEASFSELVALIDAQSGG